MPRTMRRPANPKTRHQIDELYIGSVDFSVSFVVHWALQGFDGERQHYDVDEIELLSVKHFDGEQYVAIEANEPLRDAIDEAIRYQEQRTGCLTEDANRQSERSDD